MNELAKRLLAGTATGLLLQLSAYQAHADHAEVNVTTSGPGIDLDTYATESSIHIASGVRIEDVWPDTDPGLQASTRAWTVTNDGTVAGGSNAVILDMGGMLLNGTTGVIESDPFGNALRFSNGAATLDNYGQILGGTGAVSVLAGGSVTNRIGAVIQANSNQSAVHLEGGTSRSINNSGVIENISTSGGFSAAISMRQAPGGSGNSSIVNAAGGVIRGGVRALDIYNMSTSAFSLQNAGLIESTHGVVVGIDNVAVANITNSGSGIIRNLGTEAAITMNGLGNVYNWGTITGGGPISIQFSGNFGNVVGLSTGSVINGLVDAGGGFDYLVLEGSGTESLARFVNFELLRKYNAETWTLVDSGTFSWGTEIYGGTLAVNGTLTTPTLTVAAGNGATLAGSGTVAGNVVANGIVAPGSSIGTLTVAGDVAFNSGSFFEVEIAGGGNTPGIHNDLLAVGGVATLSGGTVLVAALDPQTSYQQGQTYTILTAAGGVSGEFAEATSQSAFITPTLTHNSNDVMLTIALGTGPGQPSDGGLFPAVALTFNQTQASTALDHLEQSGDALAVFNAIVAMNADDARRAFDLSSGEIHASGQHLIDQTSALFNRTLRYQGIGGLGTGHTGADVLTAPLAFAAAPAASGVAAIDGATGGTYADERVRGAWAAPLGGFGRIDGDGNAGRLGWWNGGLAGGYEGVVDVGPGNAVAGLGFGYIRSHGSIDDRLSTFDSNGFYLGAYGAWADGPWTVAGSLAYGASRVSTERDIAFMGRTAEADYWTHTIGLSGEASYAFALSDTTRLAPLFTLDGGWSGHGGFTETGAGALNLTSGPQSWSRLDAGLGFALTHTIPTDSGRVTLEGRAVWERALADVVPSQALALAGSPAGFTVHGPGAERDRLRVGAGLTWSVTDEMTFRARYDGLFSGDQANHTASFGLNIRF